MLDLRLLECLVGFYHHNTLVEAAESLHITQPSLSRSLKKLEDDLGVILFDRKINKLEFNQLGMYVAEQAESILKELSNFSVRIQEQSTNISKFYIGSCAPGPFLFQISPLLSSIYPNNPISHHQTNRESLLEGLSMSTYDLIILDHPPVVSNDYECHKISSESLNAVLPVSHPMYNRDSVSFADMNGTSFLMYNSVGIWDSLVVNKMPDSNFLRIDVLDNLNKIATSADMCSFSTNLSQKFRSYDPSKYKVIPFSDPEATIDFYCIYRKKYASRWKVLHTNL